MTAQLFYGPAGWSYLDWNGTVYPKPKPKGFNTLGFIAEQFDFVEVNTSFYRIPPQKMCQGWIEKTEHRPDFLFWLKINQQITHHMVLNPGEIDTFFNAISPISAAGKLSGLLAQFPYSFKLNKRNFQYLCQMADIFNRFPLAIEFRHNSWHHEEVLQYFDSAQLIFTNIDQPSISLSLGMTSIVTHPEISYFRFHGRNYDHWFANTGRDNRYNYDYPLSEIKQISDEIAKLKQAAKRIFISGNNHYKGAAVKNLKQIKEILSASD